MSLTKYTIGAAALGCFLVGAFHQVSAPEKPDMQEDMMRVAGMAPGVTMAQLRRQMDMPTPCDFSTNYKVPPDCPVVKNARPLSKEKLNHMETSLSQRFSMDHDFTAARFLQEHPDMAILPSPCDFPVNVRPPDCSLLPGDPTRGSAATGIPMAQRPEQMDTDGSIAQFRTEDVPSPCAWDPKKYEVPPDCKLIPDMAPSP